MSAIMCIGQYASKPFEMKGLGVRVYCFEELCFVLRDQAYLLDMGIMTDELVEFIMVDCGLNQLGQELSDMIHKKGSLSMVVGTMLSYAGLFTNEEIEDISVILRQGGKMTDLEKQKMRIDRLVSKGKVEAALEEYAIFIANIEANLVETDEETRILLAEVWHNRGVAYSMQLSFSLTAECMKKAMDYYPEGNYADEYLAAKRLELSEKDYVTFIFEHPEFYQNSMDLESKTAALLNEWEQTEEHRELLDIKELEEQGKKLQYHVELEKIVDELVEQYHKEKGVS